MYSPSTEVKWTLGILAFFFSSYILLTLRGAAIGSWRLTLAAALAPGRLLRRWMNPDPIRVRIGKVEISTDSRVRHTHIVGATGSGKTVLLEHLIFQDIRNGLGALIIDPKGDRGLYERVKDYARSVGRAGDLHYLSATNPAESSTWNPCQLGTTSNLQTKFYQSNTYSEPHYAKACEQGLLMAFQGLLQKHPEGFHIGHLVREIEILNRKGKNQVMEGLLFDLSNLCLGEWGPLLGYGNSLAGGRPLSLLDVTRKNEILFVDLPTETSAIQSQRIGKLLLQEMMLISGLRKSRPELGSGRPFSIYVDEFDAFASESFVTFLNKGRSSGFMIHVAHQTLSDLRRISPDFAGQVMGNTNVRFVFRQDDPTDAETWAKFFGTASTVKKTWQSDGLFDTGKASNREVQEFRVSPDSIKELGIGKCIVSIKTQKVLKPYSVPSPIRIREDHAPLERIQDPARPLQAPQKISITQKFQLGEAELNEPASL